MTYNRMEAKKIPNECCYFCKDKDDPLVKMPCCEQWACCDTSFVSYRGNGRCQFEHEYYSICHSHYIDQHKGTWQDCNECHKFFDERKFDEEIEQALFQSLEH